MVAGGPDVNGVFTLRHQIALAKWNGEPGDGDLKWRFGKILIQNVGGGLRGGVGGGAPPILCATDLGSIPGRILQKLVVVVR